MNYEDKIFEFLAQPENLPIAMEVSTYVQKLKERVHQEFWELLSTSLSDRLKSSEYGDQWRFQPVPIKSWGRHWASCSIRPKIMDRKDQSSLGVALQQGTSENKYRLLIGVKWAPRPPKSYQSVALDQLVDHLRTKDLTRSSSNWPAWNWLDNHLEGVQFILNAHKDPNTPVNEVTDTLWNLFLDVCPLLIAVNQDT